MKRFSIFLTILILLSLATLSSVSAQTTQDQVDGKEEIPTEISDIPSLRAELKQYVQDPRTKEVKFEMVLNPNLDSDRVKITWEITGQSVFAKDQKTEFLAVIEKGKEYVIPIKVIPTSNGISELFGKVESFELGSSFIVTVRKTYVSNANGEILPITQEYLNQKQESTVVWAGIYVIAGIAIVVFIILAILMFIKWLNKDEVKEFEREFRTK